MTGRTADEIDWEEAYELFEPMVRATVRGVLLRDDDDLVENAFADAYAHATEKPIEDLEAFLRACARNAAVDVLRHQPVQLCEEDV